MYELEAVFNHYGIEYNSMQGKIICPFHGDINPSMLYNIEGNSFFCFGCYLRGNAMKFTMLMEGDDLKGYIKYREIISERCQEKQKNKPQIIDGPSLNHNPSSGLLYIESYNYYIGLSKSHWGQTGSSQERYMLERGFSPEVLNKVKAKININEAYPIIFPILDNGKFRGWVCRTDKKEIEQKRKYLYNRGFRRANTLVGNYNKNHIPILCEGFMDRLKFIQAGYDYAVAIFGWKISNEQIEKLKAKGIKKVISALDNDECGIKGSEYLKKHFKVIRVKYPEGVKDPGEMNTKQINKMLNQIDYIE